MHTSRHLVAALLLAALVALCGCSLDNTMPKLNAKIESLGNQITETDRKIVDTKLELGKVDLKIQHTQTDIIDNLKAQQQRASEFVFGASLATNANTPGPLTLHAQEELLRATALLGMPTQQSILDANQRLQLRLSQKEADNEELKRRYAAKDQESAHFQELLKAKESELKNVLVHRDQLWDEKDGLTNTKDNLTKDLDKEEKKLIGVQQNELLRAEDTKALKKQLTAYLTIAGILAGLGAAAAFRFYPPVVLPLGVASAGFFLAAYLVTQISKWELLGLLVVAGLAVAAAAYIRHKRVSEIADSSIGATQQLKNRALSGDTNAVRAYGELRKHLVEKFGDTGHYLEDEIQARLKKMKMVGKKPAPSLLPKIAEQSKLDANQALAAISPDVITGILKQHLAKQANS